jgi:transcriptional regulator with XRE-family HTH domain
MKGRTFGAFFKERRAVKGQTLRAFCQKNGFDPGNISKLERGLFAPPDSDEKLSEYAKALGLRHGSAPWYEFFDLAGSQRGEIPHDILSNAEVVRKLPALFRTLRGRKLKKSRFDDFIEQIRRA